MKPVLPQPAFCGYFLVNGIRGNMQRYSDMEGGIKIRHGLGMWERVKACSNYRKCDTIVSRQMNERCRNTGVKLTKAQDQRPF